VQNNRAEWVDVKTGATVGKLIEVFGDVRARGQVALRGADQIESGTSITPVPVGSETL
jgi:hypothetical protein